MPSRALALLCALSSVACHTFIEKREYDQPAGGGGAVSDGGGGIGGATGGMAGMGGSGGTGASGAAGGGGPCEGNLTFGDFADADALNDDACWSLHEYMTDGNEFALEAGPAAGTKVVRITPGDNGTNYWYDLDPMVNAPILYLMAPAQEEFSFEVHFVVTYDASDVLPIEPYDGAGIIVRAPGDGAPDWVLFDHANMGEHSMNNPTNVYGSMAFTSAMPVPTSYLPVSGGHPPNDVSMILCRRLDTVADPDVWKFEMLRQIPAEPWLALDDPVQTTTLDGEVMVGVTAHNWQDGTQAQAVNLRVSSVHFEVGSATRCAEKQQ